MAKLFEWLVVVSVVAACNCGAHAPQFVGSPTFTIHHSRSLFLSSPPCLRVCQIIVDSSSPGKMARFTCSTPGGDSVCFPCAFLPSVSRTRGK